MPFNVQLSCIFMAWFVSGGTLGRMTMVTTMYLPGRLLDASSCGRLLLVYR